jgi:hypothetical protein
VSSYVPVPPPPPAAGFARPTPPGGATVRVYEEKREEEAAPEQSQAFAAYRPDDHGAPVAVYLFGAAILAATAGASLRLGPRRRDRRQELAIAAARTKNRNDPRYQTPRRHP